MATATKKRTRPTFAGLEKALADARTALADVNHRERTHQDTLYSMRAERANYAREHPAQIDNGLSIDGTKLAAMDERLRSEESRDFAIERELAERNVAEAERNLATFRAANIDLIVADIAAEGEANNGRIVTAANALIEALKDQQALHAKSVKTVVPVGRALRDDIPRVDGLGGLIRELERLVDTNGVAVPVPRSLWPTGEPPSCQRSVNGEWFATGRLAIDDVHPVQIVSGRGDRFEAAYIAERDGR